MFFLIRALFWLCIILVLLPGDPDRPEGAPSVTVLELLTAARTAIADLSQICNRNPEMCVTTGELGAVLTEKARYGIEQLQAFVDRQATEPEAGTLTATDVAVPWQAPAELPATYAAITP